MSGTIAIHVARRRSTTLARFAAKEAMLKALGVPSGLEWHQMEVLRSSGRPEMRLCGAALNAMKAIGGERVMLTLTHTVSTAAALLS